MTTYDNLVAWRSARKYAKDFRNRLFKPASALALGRLPIFTLSCGLHKATVIPVIRDLCVTVIPASEPEPKGGDSAFNNVSKLAAMPLHEQLRNGL